MNCYRDATVALWGPKTFGKISYSANINFDTKYTIAPITSFLIENADAWEKEKKLLFSFFFLNFFENARLSSY